MKTIIIFLLLITAGCANMPSSEAAKIIESDDKGVANCKFLGSVDGSATFAGLTADDFQQSSKTEALEKAVELKATHIVWVSANKNWDNASVMGRAYSCTK